MIIIDYLQLMSSPGRVENRQQEISAISRNFKGMAKDLNVPVLALSQLSRGVEARGDHKPDDESVANMATIIIGKQRNGPIGQFDLHFHKEYTRFNDLAR